MENASKALIIAGAILISILLITLGIIVYNGSKSTIDTSMGSLDSTAVQMTNSKIMQYVSNNQSAPMVSALINQLAAEANNNGESVEVSLGSATGKKASKDILALASSVKTGSRYKVEAGEPDAYTGLIKSVTITEIK